MSYIKPRMVLSPKGKVENLVVLYDGGEGEWSLARMEWHGSPCIGIRWNGSSDSSRPALGNPQSRGIPTWFILPDKMANVAESVVEDLLKRDRNELPPSILSARKLLAKTTSTIDDALEITRHLGDALQADHSTKDIEKYLRAKIGDAFDDIPNREELIEKLTNKATLSRALQMVKTP